MYPVALWLLFLSTWNQTANKINFFSVCLCIFSFFPQRSITACRHKIVFPFWLSSEISQVFEQQQHALFCPSADTITDVYMSEAPTALFALCNVVEDGPFRGVSYNLSRKLYMWTACIAFIFWASLSPPVAFHVVIFMAFSSKQKSHIGSHGSFGPCLWPYYINFLTESYRQNSLLHCLI